MAVKNVFYFLAGLAFLLLAKIKNLMQGYTSPKPFELSETKACVDYDIAVVDHWLEHLERYTGAPGFHLGRRTLELGPGSDLGIGLYLLAQGCERYSACDVNDLMAGAPTEFYDAMLAELDQRELRAGEEKLRPELESARAGRPSSLNYIVRDDFDLVAALGNDSTDLVLSQAAFEHFDDVGATMAGLFDVCTPGTVIATEIDLMTHSRWIRDQDPNNIYRYPQWLYSLLTFRGSPTRLRPHDYVKAFEDAGWTNIEVQPLQTVKGEDYKVSGMYGRYAQPVSQMDALSIMVCATRPGVPESSPETVLVS